MNITTLKGIGTKTAELFAKLGIYTTQDLLKFYPRDYDVYEEPILVDELTSDYEATVLAVYGIIARKIDVYDTGKLSIISTIVRDEKGKAINLNAPSSENFNKFSFNAVRLFEKV